MIAVWKVTYWQQRHRCEELADMVSEKKMFEPLMISRCYPKGRSIV
jgi:hypothetical protein